MLLDDGSGEKQIEKTKISNLDSHPRKHIPRPKPVSPYGFGSAAGGLSRMLDRSSQSVLGESFCIDSVYQAATNHLLKIKTPCKPIRGCREVRCAFTARTPVENVSCSLIATFTTNLRTRYDDFYLLKNVLDAVILSVCTNWLSPIVNDEDAHLTIPGCIGLSFSSQ